MGTSIHISQNKPRIGASYHHQRREFFVPSGPLRDIRFVVLVVGDKIDCDLRRSQVLDVGVARFVVIREVLCPLDCVGRSPQ